MTQKNNKNIKNKQNKTAMIVSRVASESIRNINKSKNSNKHRNEVCNTMKQHPNMLDMFYIYCKK
jgi:hypothetical protein